MIYNNQISSHEYVADILETLGFLVLVARMPREPAMPLCHLS
jgi:hypothetical protein